MTWSQLLAWADDDTLAEWIEGEVSVTSPESEQNDP